MTIIAHGKKILSEPIKSNIHNEFKISVLILLEKRSNLFEIRIALCIASSNNKVTVYDFNLFERFSELLQTNKI